METAARRRGDGACGAGTADLQSGRILVVLDGDKEFLDRIEPQIAIAGATHLPYEASKAMA
jgi:hypothetical protein